MGSQRQPLRANRRQQFARLARSAGGRHGEQRPLSAAQRRESVGTLAVDLVHERWPQGTASSASGSRPGPLPSASRIISTSRSTPNRRTRAAEPFPQPGPRGGPGAAVPADVDGQFVRRPWDEQARRGRIPKNCRVTRARRVSPTNSRITSSLFVSRRRELENSEERKQQRAARLDLSF